MCVSVPCDLCHHVIHVTALVDQYGEMRKRRDNIISGMICIATTTLLYTIHYYSTESVLAAEVVQMFCLVPTFMDILIHQSHPG